MDPEDPTASALQLLNRFRDFYLIIILFFLLRGPALADCTLSIAATTPAPRPNEAALKQHADLLQRTAVVRPEFVLIGDSMAQRWPTVLVEQMAGGRRSLNLGIGGDRVENVLWRLQQMKIGLNAVKVYILAVGTNNLAALYPSCAVSAGIRRVTEELRAISPQAQILIMQIPPIYRDGERFEAERRKLNQELRATALAVLTSSGNLACGEKSCSNYQSDRLHLSNEAYGIITNEIISKILQK